MENDDGSHVVSSRSLSIDERIPTYVITALYFGPFAVWLYWRYGFMKHQKERDEPGQADNHTHSNTHQHHEMNEHRNMHGHHHHDSQAEDHAMKISDAPNQSQHHDIHHHHETAAIDHQDTKLNRDPHIRHQKPTPFYVSVLVGVTHCGAGCVLGDIVGEWLVYGTNVSINGRTLWPEMLIGTFPSDTNPRLRVRSPLRHTLPVLFYRPHERKLGSYVAHTSCQSGHSFFDSV